MAVTGFDADGYSSAFRQYLAAFVKNALDAHGVGRDGRQGARDGHEVMVPGLMDTDLFHRAVYLSHDIGRLVVNAAG
jgi:hypothetical protein